jgi:hypothetical protein
MKVFGIGARKEQSGRNGRSGSVRIPRQSPSFKLH